MAIMMHLLVFYDISEDKVRNKVACACEDYGLDRIQLSAFYGRLSRTLQRELFHKLSDLLGESPGCIQLVPIASDEWEKRLEVGNVCSMIVNSSR